MGPIGGNSMKSWEGERRQKLEYVAGGTGSVVAAAGVLPGHADDRRHRRRIVVALVLLPGTVPVIAALTALLVVEVTLFDIVTSGVQRVVSVVAGVMLAVWFSSFVEITWWSLGILVAASIMIGQILRLGPHLVEVPISAMLVLGVGGAEGPASDRIVETLIGAAVGVAVNLLSRRRSAPTPQPRRCRSSPRKSPNCWKSRRGRCPTGSPSKRHPVGWKRRADSTGTPRGSIAQWCKQSRVAN